MANTALFGKFAVLALSAALLFPSCKDHDDEINPDDSGKIGIHFDNRAGANDLVLNNAQAYTTALGQEVKISQFDYYISNVKFTNADGSTYTVPQAESYFLIKESAPSSQELEITIPEGDYTGVTFTVGVDSARSAMDISMRTGVLDPAAGGQGMYWSWNSGYIFLKMEGTSPSAPLDTTSNQRPFMFHIGGFGGYSSPTINNLKTVSISFGQSVEVRDENHGDHDHAHAAPNVHLYVDALAAFNGTTNVDLSSNAITMFNAFSTTISANYANMFALDHIH
jgi:hypothetical protein